MGRQPAFNTFFAWVRSLYGGTAQPVPMDEASRVESPFLTVPEAAQYLRSTAQTIYDWVKRGKLHPVPGIRGKRLFTRDELDRFAKTRRRK